MLTVFCFCQAVELIDGEIGPAFAAIRKQREASGSAYFDAVTYAQGSFSRIPEALRPKPGRLSIAQQQVYDVKLKSPFLLLFMFTNDFFVISRSSFHVLRILSRVFGKLSLVRIQLLYLLALPV